MYAGKELITLQKVRDKLAAEEAALEAEKPALQLTGAMSRYPVFCPWFA